MKTLSILSTVLGVRLVSVVGDSAKDYYVREHNGIEVVIGLAKDYLLVEAVQSVVEKLFVETEDSDFFIVPIQTKRSEFYYQIEHDLITQANANGGTPIHEDIPQGDPRVLVECVMESLRTCAVTIREPEMFAQNMLHVASMAIASLQWCKIFRETLRTEARLSNAVRTTIITGKGINGNDQTYER